MAHYSVHVGGVNRSKGENAIASAAYIARAKLNLKLVDKETNIPFEKSWDYRNKPGLAYSKIYIPDDLGGDVLEWVLDREKLWNAAEAAETRVNSITAGKIMAALPKELSHEQNIALLEEIIYHLTARGMIVDANIHNDKENNPHAHLQHSTRELVKNRYNEFEFSRIKNRDWQGRKYVKEVRALIADITNKHYAKNGFDLRVSEKSYKEQGIDIKPGVHEGPARNIKGAELVALNLSIAKENAKKIKEKPSIILDLLALNSPVFTKDQIARELDKRLNAGIDYSKIKDLKEIESLQKDISEQFTIAYHKILSSPEITLVIDSDLKGNELYTTTKRIELEERFTSTVSAMHAKNSHGLNVSKEDLEHLSHIEKLEDFIVGKKKEAISLINAKTGLKLTSPKDRITLTSEQSKAVLDILNGPDIAILEGLPGAGKTMAMNGLVRQYNKKGFKAIGVTTSSSAALELSKATGIECRNAALWRKTWQEARNQKFELILRGDFYKEDQYNKDTPFLAGNSVLTSKHVVIVDEASMMELANMYYILIEAMRAGAKIIFIGDNNQLAAVGWMGAFYKAASICGSSKLTQSRRQRDASDLEATRLLSEYKIKQALDIYWNKGAVKLFKNDDRVLSELSGEFTSSYIKTANCLARDDLVSIKSIAIGVFANATRDKLNDRIRTRLKEAGVLKGESHRVLVGSCKQNGAAQKKYLDLARGDQIVFTRNANHLGSSGIFNGELATVLKVGKPNRDSLTYIDLLVHKASGSKERIRFDLRELAEQRYFHDGIAIDYGYSVTAHKVQGASIDQFMAYIEKGLGYEVFNVLATRHKEHLSIFASKETLMNAHFESLDETSFKAKNRFDLKVEDEIEVLKSGLRKIISKRTNISFASDYRSMGLHPSDKLLKDYIDTSCETIAVIRRITEDQDLAFRRSGNRPKLWDHPDWDKFKDLRFKRAASAKIITNNYADFKERLVQSNLNYATIEKHASQLDKSKKEASFLVDTKLSILHEGQEYKNLVAAVGAGKTSLVCKVLGNLKHQVKETNLEIEHLSEQREVLLEREQFLKDEIELQEDFTKAYTPEYLGRIYRSSKDASKSEKEGFKAAGLEALDKYKQLVKEHGSERAAEMVTERPSLLGNLRGVGFGKFMRFGKAGRDATSLLDKLPRHLEGYNKALEMIQEAKENLAKEEFAQKIGEIDKSIEESRSVLPSNLDKIFFGKIEVALNSDKARRALKDLSGSELFTSIAEAVTTAELMQDDDRSILKNISIEPEKHLKFSEVSKDLTTSDIECIFRKFAPKMNPSDDIEKNGNRIICGSMQMTLGGDKAGLWKRWSNNTGGNIYNFVCQALGCSKLEALEIVADIIEQRPEIAHAEIGNQEAVHHDKASLSSGKNGEWVVLARVPDSAPRFTPKRHLAYLSKKSSTVELTHEYKDIEGRLLGYAVRIKDEKSGKKQVLPVACVQNEVTGKLSWCLRGFSDNGTKPIYKAETLTANPIKPVLIVEGEKTADKAARMLPEYNVISWMGGSGAAVNVNWEVLKAKEVAIWPDNDEVGKGAARIITEQIDAVNGFSGMARIIDVDALKLPEKWDLADDLPKHITRPEVKSLISKAFQNSLDSGGIEFKESLFKLESKVLIERIREYTELKLDDLKNKESNLDEINKDHTKVDYGSDNAKNDIYKQRLNAELEVIEKTGFARDFILANQVVSFAKSHNIDIGPGRGSAVGSLTAYLLGIHKIDPIEHDLSFERFLTQGPKKQPDFDIDISSSKKPILENLLFAKYPEASKLEVIDKNGKVGTHPAGVIFTSKQVRKESDIVISAVKSAGRIVRRASIDKNKAEALQIRKVDLLSSKVVDKLSQAEQEVSTKHGSIDWHQINWHDSKVNGLITSADTGGVFQLSGDYAKGVIEGLQIKNAEEFISLQALVRPGAKNKLQEYKAGNSAGLKYPELAKTRGVILYQEQIMKLAENYLGIEKDKSDDFRRDLAKLAKGDLWKEQINVPNNAQNNEVAKANKLITRDGFIEKAGEVGGLSPADAGKLYKDMLDASSYSFNKSHAVAYSQVTFKTAYIKAHHPEIFKEVFEEKSKKVKAEIIEITKATTIKAPDVTSSLLKAMNTLAKQGVIKRDNYVSAGLYKQTLKAIATNKDLKINAENYIESLQLMQGEYREMQEHYDKSVATGSNNHNQQIAASLMRETCILEQARVNKTALPNSYLEHIKAAISASLPNKAKLTNAEIKTASESLAREVNLKSWQEKLKTSEAKQAFDASASSREARTEAAKIDIALEKFAIEKQNATDASKFITVFREEQEFTLNINYQGLTSSHETLTKQAKQYHKESLVDNLEKAIVIVIDDNIKKPSALLTTLKSTSQNNTCLSTVLTDLSKSVYGHYKPVMKEHLELIKQNGELNIAGHNFKSQIQYLKHIRNKPTNSFMMQHMDKHIEQHQAQQKQLEMSMRGPQL